jgi:segregation and condensation protein B
MNKEKLKNIIEAALMVSDRPLSISRLLSLFEKDLEQPDRTEIRSALDDLNKEYEGHGVELKEVASGFRIQVCNEYAEWVNRLYDERPPRYSRALLETLAIIAYRQPLTRAEIEDIRGVSVSSTITKTLQEREWIKVVGHRDVPGKPELLATTKEFLDYFNLKKLSDLPLLSEIKDFNQMNPDLFAELEKDNTLQESNEHGSDVIYTGKEDSIDKDEVIPDSIDEESIIFIDNEKVVPFTH